MEPAGGTATRIFHRPSKKNALLSFALVWWLVHLPFLEARVSAITVMIPLITAGECEARRAASVRPGPSESEEKGPCCMKCVSRSAREAGESGDAASADLAGRSPISPASPMKCFLCVRMNDLNVIPEIAGRPLPTLQLAGQVGERLFTPVDQSVRPPVPPPKVFFLS